MDDKNEVLVKSKELAQNWLENFNLSGKHDLAACHKALCGRKGPDGEPVLALVVSSPEEAADALKQGAYALSILGEKWKTNRAVSGATTVAEQISMQVGKTRYKKFLTGLKNYSAPKDVTESLTKASLCVWDYYLMAFYESSMEAAGLSNYFTNEKLLPAFSVGVGYVINMGSLIVGVCLPEAYRDDQNRIHKENGPSIVWGATEEYWWHGTKVPEEWIMNPSSLKPEEVLAMTNTELRRSACEIIGWDKILDKLNSVVLDKHEDQEIGTLVEVDLPDALKEKFLLVRCGTGRLFAVPMPAHVTTALEGQHEIYPHIPVEMFEKRQVRS